MSTILAPATPVALLEQLTNDEPEELWVNVGSDEPLQPEDFDARVRPLLEEAACCSVVAFYSDSYALDDEPEDTGYTFDQWWVLRKD